MESFTVTIILPAHPKEIFNAWLSSEGHSQMTGSKAEVQKEKGGSFTAWDGYIRGITIETEPNRRILQAWRTSEFPKGSPDSSVEILLEAISTGTKVTLKHMNIPDGQGANYKQGWDDFYFTPMKRYFSKQ